MYHNHFCTIIDKTYIFKLLALYNSLKEQTRSFHLWICCVDEITFNLLSKMQLDNITLTQLKEIEDERVIAVKPNRKLYEYCWTLKAVYICYLFKYHHEIDAIIYIDGDLFFFFNPKEIYKRWGTASIFICSQRAAKHTVKRTGMYQAGLIGFKRHKNTFLCLEWWRDKCLEWCFDQFEDARWADQKYLDQWPQLFESIKVIDNFGINAAFWNIRLQKVHGKNNKIYVEHDRLVVFHFSGLEIFTSSEFELCKHRKLNKNHINLIYLPYIKAIRNGIQQVKKVDKFFGCGFSNKENKDTIYNHCKYNSSIKNIILKK